MTATLFDGHRRVMTGSVYEAALAFKRAMDDGSAGPLLIFDDATGRVIDIDPTRDLDYLADEAPTLSSSSAEPADATAAPEPRKRGRPKLGVVAREVTLLPRHWEWLNAQPGGGSVALRKLVDEARRASAVRDREREARDATYRFIHAVAGDLPGFEEATRALFAGDHSRFVMLMHPWPRDVRIYAGALLSAA